MPFGSEQWMYASGGFYPHEIDNSARLGTNSYYTRTPPSASNRTTWTWSGWVKMSLAASQNTLFFAEPAVTDYAGIIITAGSQLQLINRPTTGVNASLISTQVFRDPSAWYHLVGVWDTTNSTQADRVRLYVNGERVTSFSTSTLPAQNAVSAINSTGLHEIGATVVASGGASNFYNGYITEVNFVDGQALDPTSFGQFKSGVWIPKSYSGTYGTNGFYLDFATRATDPIDASGNGNNWGSVNVVSTDWMLDSPTNNFATLNPLDDNYNHLLSEGNTRAYSPSITHSTIKSGIFVNSGKWYAEFLIINESSVGAMVGVASRNTSGKNYLGATSGGVGYNHDGNIFANGNAPFAGGSPFFDADIVGIAVDVDANEIKFYINNSLQTTLTSLMASEICFAAGHGGEIVALNCGQDSSFAGNKTAQGNTDANGIGDFYYAPPAGYLALCTANLPDPVTDPAQDDVPADYFNTVLYTGTGADLDVDTVGFQSDLVWLKSRSNATTWHILADGVRGANNHLSSNNGEAEKTDAEGVGFIADGFSLGADSVDAYYGWNLSGNTYVAWNWLAGNGTTSNTDGTITSTVSANQKAGFSIVSYTDGGIYTATIGHGLSQKPDLYICKTRSATSDWFVFTDVVSGSWEYLRLNTTGTSTGALQSANSTTFNPVGISGSSIAYCFHSVEGFSKFGSYTGNGSTDGPFVYTGFRPAFVMVKRTDVAGAGWIMLDTGRDTFNTLDSYLIANSSNSEGTLSLLDFLSNGLKLRGTDGGVNGNTNTYIYMAFAEMPFKYANAR